LTDLHIDRRSFLKTTLAGMFVLFSATPAFAKKTATRRLPEGKLSLFNINNNEKLTVTYRNSNGEYDHEALCAIDRILRCPYTEEVARIDIRTIEYLNRIDKRLGGGNEIHVISGYRSPAYNRHLRLDGHHVAKRSLHVKGKAIDIAIPNIKTEIVRQTALKLRTGGVGYYPDSGFVHIDSGPFRTW
jgi:uncharacterized protein YcbK (DUF882 family)